MGRPLPQALAEQQKVIERLRQTVATQGLVIDYIAKVAGITPQITALRKAADVDNPAQPYPDPPGTTPSETTEQAATPEAYDSPLNPGQTPGSVQQLPAETTGTPMDPGSTLPTAPYTDLVDVQAPIEGTQTHVPNEQTRTEVDVRVGDPMNLQRAYPWTLGPDAQGSQGSQAQASNRTMASIRLAKLRLQAGTAAGEELQVAATIEGNQGLSTEAIEQEIGTLSGVMKAASRRTHRPTAAVPRSASVQRTTPSLVNGEGLTVEAGSTGLEADMVDADIFLN